MAPSRKSAALSPAELRAYPYWGVISYAADTGLGTADLWSMIRDEAERLGLDSPGVTVQGVSGLRGRAGAITRTARALADAADSKRLGSQFIAAPPWQRSGQERRAGRQYQARFLHTVTVNGVEQTEWRTTKFSGQLPRTVGDLRALAESDAIQIGRKYLGEHVAVSGIQLLEV